MPASKRDNADKTKPWLFAPGRIYLRVFGLVRYHTPASRNAIRKRRIFNIGVL
jgi:hypothetical protein